MESEQDLSQQQKFANLNSAIGLESAPSTFSCEQALAIKEMGDGWVPLRARFQYLDPWQEERSYSFAPRYLREMTQYASLSKMPSYHSADGLKSRLLAKTKRLMFKVSKPWIKICLLHQQNLNDLVITLASSVVSLESRVKHLENRLNRMEKDANNRQLPDTSQN